MYLDGLFCTTTMIFKIHYDPCEKQLVTSNSYCIIINSLLTFELISNKKTFYSVF